MIIHLFKVSPMSKGFHLSLRIYFSTHTWLFSENLHIKVSALTLNSNLHETKPTEPCESPQAKDSESLLQPAARVLFLWPLYCASLGKQEPRKLPQDSRDWHENWVPALSTPATTHPTSHPCAAQQISLVSHQHPEPSTTLLCVPDLNPPLLSPSSSPSSFTTPPRNSCSGHYTL